MSMAKTLKGVALFLFLGVYRVVYSKARGRKDQIKVEEFASTITTITSSLIILKKESILTHYRAFEQVSAH